jgi:hypothetical protein
LNCGTASATAMGCREVRIMIGRWISIVILPGS